MCKKLFGLLTCLSVLLAFSVFAEAKPTAQIKPADPVNVLLVVADDLGAMDIAGYGSSFYETPNIDKLAAQGIKFTNAYSSSPVCSSSRAALQTGRAPERIKITDWIPGYAAMQQGKLNKPLITPEILNELPLSEVTLAEVFKAKGYSTFFAGKWHLGAEDYMPEHQGYDINIGGNHTGHPKSYYSPYQNPNLQDGPEGEYLTDRLTNETLAFMQAQPRDKPFFAMLSYYTVHTPLKAAEPYIKHYEKKAADLPKLETAYRQEKNNSYTKERQDDPVYASMVHALDVNIGRLMAGLKAQGLDKNTLVIFTSDNGALTTNKKPNSPTSSAFRAGKAWVYEGGVRIPLIFSLPGSKQSKQYDEPVILTDIAPTLYELAGINTPDLLTLDGQSLAKLMLNDTPLKRDQIQIYYPHYHDTQAEPAYMVRAGDWKLVYFYQSDTAELYNLISDTAEHFDLASEHPEIVRHLQAGMEAWLNRVKAQQPIKK